MRKMFKYLPIWVMVAPLLMSMPSNAQTEATFYTNHGTFVVKLEVHLAPITAGNFVDLVEAKFYDGVIFHRIIDSFMIQGGDPTGTGSGGPGYTIMDEFDPSLSNVQMAISMANSGPNTGGSQFFINLVDNTYLDHDKPPFTSKHAVFGIVVNNFSVVQAIGKVPTNAQDRPINDVVMDSVRITKVSAVSVNHRPEFALELAPNPSVDATTVRFSNESVKSGLLEVHAMNGQLVHAVEFMGEQGTQALSIPTGHFDAGLYVVTVSDGTAVRTAKLLVQ